MGLFGFLRRKEIALAPPSHQLVRLVMQEGFMMYLENIKAARSEFSESDRAWLLRLYELEVPPSPRVESVLGAEGGEVRQIRGGKYLLIATHHYTSGDARELQERLVAVAPSLAGRVSVSLASIDESMFN